MITTIAIATCRSIFYIFCGRFLPAAKLWPANIDGAAGAVEEVSRIVGQIRARWPKMRITRRGESGFCREELMAWCETNTVDYLIRAGPNSWLKAVVGREAWQAKRLCERTGQPARLAVQGLRVSDRDELESAPPGRRQSRASAGRR